MSHPARTVEARLRQSGRGGDDCEILGSMVGRARCAASDSALAGPSRRSVRDLTQRRRGLHDPYPLIDEVRGSGGVIRRRCPWARSTTSRCRAMLRDPRFGVRPADSSTTCPKPLAVARRSGSRCRPIRSSRRPCWSSTRPSIREMRKPVASAFTPRAVGQIARTGRDGHGRTARCDARERFGRSDQSFAAQGADCHHLRNARLPGKGPKEIPGLGRSR